MYVKICTVTRWSLWLEEHLTQQSSFLFGHKQSSNLLDTSLYCCFFWWLVKGQMQIQIWFEVTLLYFCLLFYLSSYFSTNEIFQGNGKPWNRVNPIQFPVIKVVFYSWTKSRDIVILKGEKYFRYCVKMSSSKIPNNPVIKITKMSHHNSFLLQGS